MRDNRRIPCVMAGSRNADGGTRQIWSSVVKNLHLNQAATQSDGHGLCPVARTQLFHDVLHVDLYRLFGNEEAIGDIAVSISPADQLEYLHLTLSQGFIAEMLSKTCRHIGRNALLSGVNQTDRFSHVGRRRGLEDVGASARCQSALDFSVALKSSQHDDARLRKFLQN